jgi:mRNA-degrading endonuclease RelE of RelBE toxin-antitoxin system
LNVYSRSSFDRALKHLSPEIQQQVLDAARRLPSAFGRPHQHSGLGLRRIGSFYEFRVGLQWRVLFIILKSDAVLLTVGNHNEIVRYVREHK